MTLDVISLIGLLLLSGFFSSSELAFVVANKLKIEIRARKNNLTAKNAQYFMNRPQIFFSTILISNNVVNITFASMLTIFLISLYQFSDFVILIISSVLLLLFGELIPKYIAREYADQLVLFSSLPVRAVTIILYPFVKLTSSISALITNTRNITEELEVTLDKEDIHSLIEEGSEAGKLDEKDSDIIRKIMDLSEQKVYEAMTPRTDIVGVNIESEISEVIKVFIESGYSKLPVYMENLDNIVGVVHAYDMFKSPETLKPIVRDVAFVPQTKKSLEMLNEFLDKQESITIIVDEFGGTAGILTVEDLIEEMFGEILDEYDVEDSVCKKVDDNSYVISGKMEIDFLNEEHDLNIEEGDYETLAGYIISKLGRIPIKGESIQIGNFSINILHSSKTKVNLIKLFIKPSAKAPTNF